MIMAEESMSLKNNRKRVRPEKTVKRGAPRNMIRRAMKIKRKVMSLSPDQEGGSSFSFQKDS
jgi:hypothetical protein